MTTPIHAKPAASKADYTRQKLARVSIKAHRAMRFRPAGDYFFAAKATHVGIVSAELAQAAVTYPLAFIETTPEEAHGVDEPGVELVALLSIVPGRNLFVTPDGGWLGEFTPASINTYPFLYRQFGGTGGAALLVDQHSGLLTPDQGKPLFDAEGKPSDTTKEIVRVLRGLEKNRRATRKACAKLKECRLLVPWGAETEVEEFKKLLRVDEAAFHRLPQGVFSMLRQVGALAIAYAQLVSLAVLPRLAGLARRHAMVDAQRQKLLSSCFRAETDLGDTFKF